MAVKARRSLKDASSRSFFFIFIRLPLLCTNPSVEVLRTIHVHPQQHLRVMRSAVLRALAKKQAGLVRIQPRFVHAIRNQAGLSRALRYPTSLFPLDATQFHI